MEESRYRERVLDSRLYYFDDPVTFKRYAMQEQIVEVQEVPPLVESRIILANSRNRQITVEQEEPLIQFDSWWGCSWMPNCQPCCEREKQPIAKVKKNVHEPYISPLRLGYREKKPWTTYKDKIVMGATPEVSFLN